MAGVDGHRVMSDQPAPLHRWHAVVESKDPTLLDDLLADEVVFRSRGVRPARWQGTHDQLPERGAESSGADLALCQPVK